MRAAPPDLTSLAACFGPLQPRRPVAPSRPPLAGCRPRKSQLTPAQRLAPLPRCVAPRPPLAISRTMTTLTCAAVAGLWRASGPGAAVGRLCCQPAAPAAGWAQVLGWCRLAYPQAALWRFRSRARPRPLLYVKPPRPPGSRERELTPRQKPAKGRRRARSLDSSRRRNLRSDRRWIPVVGVRLD